MNDAQLIGEGNTFMYSGMGFFISFNPGDSFDAALDNEIAMPALTGVPVRYPAGPLFID